MNLKNMIFKVKTLLTKKQSGESCFSYITDMLNVSFWQVYSCNSEQRKTVDKIMQIISLDANPEPENPIQCPFCYAKFCLS